MHEYSVVQALLEQCETHAKANDATQIVEVTVKIGVQSGIEVHLFEKEKHLDSYRLLLDVPSSPLLRIGRGPLEWDQYLHDNLE